MKTITVEQVMGYYPCASYDRARVEELFAGRAALTPHEVAALDIPASDRLWPLLRGWPEVRQTWQAVVVERAIRRRLGKSGSPEWETWAAGWLSGHDRSEEAAGEARATTDAVAREAAWAAAWAAVDARAAWAVESAEAVSDAAAKAAAESETWATWAAPLSATAREEEQQVRDYIAALETVE